MTSSGFSIRPATVNDVPVILALIKELAVYEKLEKEVVATEDGLRDTLFGPVPYARVLIASLTTNSTSTPVGYALYFFNYSTFLAKPGIYLEDLYVKPEYRGKGYGKGLLLSLTKIAKELVCGRVEWSVLDWNEPSIKFYKSLGALPQDGWSVYRVTGAALDNLAAEADNHLQNKINIS